MSKRGRRNKVDPYNKWGLGEGAEMHHLLSMLAVLNNLLYGGNDEEWADEILVVVSKLAVYG